MKRPEQIIQRAVFYNLKALMIYQNYNQFMAFQIKNETGVGGKKGEVLGQIAKSMGTMAGVSDSVFLFPSYGKTIVDLSSPQKASNGDVFPTKRITMPPKTVFVEFKAYKPLKTKEIDVLSLLSPAQIEFKKRVESLGFEYVIVAAQNADDALRQVYKILRENNVAV